jgi:hypothetical protein
MTQEEKVVLSHLLSEVKDKSLENILRKVIFSGENVIEMLMIERPETKLKGFKEYAKVN